MKKKFEPFQRAVLLTLIITLFFAGSSLAAQSSFRMEFMRAREANRFEALISIVKNNKDNIPAEVNALLKDALSGDKTFYERMRIIDTASALAAMHKYWNSEDKPLIEVEAVQKQLITAENERLADVEKLARYERYPGNVLINAKEAKVSARGLSAVVFSHWSHRLFYECKACHNGLFRPERGTNDISHAAMLEGLNPSKGRFCGACHNGSIAFGSDETCAKCHSASKNSKTGPVEPSTDIDLTNVKHAGDGLGVVWEPEKLVNRALPLDRLGLIDWMELRKSGAYAPLKSHNKAKTADQALNPLNERDNVIIFTPRMPHINKVLFSHASHTKEINCDTCHPSVFKDALGANKISMAEMAGGKACGYCHGKVAFKFADCKRCHSINPTKKPLDGGIEPLREVEPQGQNILTR